MKTGLYQKTDLKRLEGSMTKFTKFLSDDAGAVTIGWVALTSGVLLLGLLVRRIRARAGNAKQVR